MTGSNRFGFKLYDMTRIYLDTSLYNRPLDDQTQPKVFLEAQAAILIFQMVEARSVELVSSWVLEYENSRNPFLMKQQLMSRYLQMASIRQVMTEAIWKRSEHLEQQGFKAIDALHVACAEATDSDYFITCDKRLINRYKENIIAVANPVDFILEVEGNDSSQK